MESSLQDSKDFGLENSCFEKSQDSNKKKYLVVESESEASIIVINSCTVTNKADREVRSYARKCTKEGKRVIFTGCGVKHLGKNLFKQNAVYSVFSHSHKEDLRAILDSKNRVNLVKEKNKNHVDSSIFPQIVGRVRAFIKIQEGCNFKCSYCVIPSVRGAARSFSERQILKQVEILAQNGVSEVILTGTNIGSYGLDTGSHIADLLLQIDEIKGIKRIRLGSLEPSQIDARFLGVLGELRSLEKHLHIAIQHTHPTMLKIMNRKNTFERDLELFCELSSRGMTLGTDFIVGHNGESESIFESALQNLQKLPLTHIHPFIYSPRLGTASAKNAEGLEIVRGDVAKKRLRLVQNMIEQKNLDFRMRNKDKILKVLIDGEKNYENNNVIESYITGLDEYFNRILVPLQSKFLDSIESVKKGSWIEVSQYDVKDYNIANNFRIL
ncbi:MiaB/RimO family radical SAM methylthiotransferase [Helicobacter saguini]|uniref:MiaB/RimO family radical SAM methylthiotransferase n=2 Tax=Helicobacter saguini TaxID=1548018 RepID=A0A347VU03_9HELI|nr:MiaB/RimO family radical SAM methylthiotransferase [Helicobacter saguini]MWV68162.1 MiaB/RimO family radical SAM methylthiotransferase [Helicobacter saguini]MWV70375.1 MiaB/RimO family radical SAM methylthiotransferase [Helicobacter saguini]MWV72276.1 MiaB/RimO family radical SAM methylthiotransferase [Helicobacter saguini]TLD95366.1 MiaB/RimO family radical SAM methylthiotransferase [Helicobacter saguini]